MLDSHGLLAGASGVYSLASDAKSFCVCFLSVGSFCWFYSLPTHLYWFSKYLVSNLISTEVQCDRAWWLMLTGLSWLPYALCSVCPMAPPSGTIPQAHLLLTCLTSPIWWLWQTSFKLEVVIIITCNFRLHSCTLYLKLQSIFSTDKQMKLRKLTSFDIWSWYCISWSFRETNVSTLNKNVHNQETIIARDTINVMVM